MPGIHPVPDVVFWHMDRPRISALAPALVALGVVLGVTFLGGSAAHAQGDDPNCVEVLPGVFDCSGGTTTVPPTTTPPPTTTAPTTTVAPTTTAPPATTTPPPATTAAPATTAPPATTTPPPPPTAPPTTAAEAPTAPSTTAAPTTTEAEAPSLGELDINRSDAGQIELSPADDGSGAGDDTGTGTDGSSAPPESSFEGRADAPDGDEEQGGLQRADINGDVAAGDLDGGNNGLLFLIAPIIAGLVIVAAVATWTVLQGAAVDREPVAAGAGGGPAPAFDD